MKIAFYGSSLLSSYWNGAATYYRGILRALATFGHDITFYEPDAFDRQKHRDIDPPDWCRVVVYEAAPRAAARREVEASGRGRGRQGERRRLRGRRLLTRRDARRPAPDALRVFWDVDAPATLAEMRRDPRPSAARRLPARPRAHLWRRRSRGRGLPGPGRARLRPDLQRARSRHAFSGAAAIRASPATSPSSATACRTARRGSSVLPRARAAMPTALPARRQRAGRTSACRPTSATSATSTRATTTPSTHP
jgi:hypothetical protein